MFAGELKKPGSVTAFSFGGNHCVHICMHLRMGTRMHARARAHTHVTTLPQTRTFAHRRTPRRLRHGDGFLARTQVPRPALAWVSPHTLGSHPESSWLSRPPLAPYDERSRTYPANQGLAGDQPCGHHTRVSGSVSTDSSS